MYFDNKANAKSFICNSYQNGDIGAQHVLYCKIEPDHDFPSIPGSL